MFISVWRQLSEHFNHEKEKAVPGEFSQKVGSGGQIDLLGQPKSEDGWVERSSEPGLGRWPSATTQ